MLNYLNKNWLIVQLKMNSKVKDVMVVKCMMVLLMLLNMVLPLDQNIHMLELINNVQPKRPKPDINLLVLLMLNHSTLKPMLKLLLNMLSLLVSMLQESTSNSTRKVSTMPNVMEVNQLLITELPMLDMLQITI